MLNVNYFVSFFVVLYRYCAFLSNLAFIFTAQLPFNGIFIAQICRI